MRHISTIILVLFVTQISYPQAQYYFNNTLLANGDGTKTNPWNHMDYISIIPQNVSSLEIYFHESPYPYTRTQLNGTDDILYSRKKNTSHLKITSYNNNPKSSYDKVIFDGQNIFMRGFEIQPESITTPMLNIQISKVEFMNFIKHPIAIRGFRNQYSFNYVDGVLISECKIYNTRGDFGQNSAGIRIALTKNITITKCNITNEISINAETDGIYMDDTETILIKNNFIFLKNDIILPDDDQPHVDCIQITRSQGTYGRGPGSSNVTIHNNYLENASKITGTDKPHNHRQVIYADSIIEDIKINNNILVSSQGNNLINVHFNEVTDSVKIFNNTIVGKGNQEHLVNIKKKDNSLITVQRFSIRNNIIYKEGATNTDAIKFENINTIPLSNHILNNNLYFFSNGTPTLKFGTVAYLWNQNSAKWEYNGREGNPLFELSSSDDFRIKYESPAKNLGKGLKDENISADYIGKSRPYWNNDYDAGAFEREDTQLKFTSDVGEVTTHYLTCAGTYWERNSSGVTGVFNISTDQGLGSATCETPANAPNDNEIWKFPGIEYKWLDWSNNNSGSRIAAGLYKISNNSNNAYFYLDLRDAVETYNLNIYLKLIGGEFPKYQYRQNGTFETHAIENGSVKRIWEINSGQPSTIGLSEYWANCLVPLAMDNNPFIVWGPYPSSYSMELHNYQISRKLDVLDWGVLTTTNSSTFQYKDESYNLGNSFPAYYKVRKVEGVISEYSEYTNTVIINVHGSQVGKYSLETEVFNFVLEQNYPNPFNPNTTISFSIPEEELVVLKLYDILGKEVKVLVSSIMNAGRYNVTVDLSSLSSGIYFYSMNAGEYSSIRKMQLLK